jgi:hypothetical protein
MSIHQVTALQEQHLRDTAEIDRLNAENLLLRTDNRILRDKLATQLPTQREDTA